MASLPADRMTRPLGMNFDGGIAFIGVEQNKCAFDIARRIFRVVIGPSWRDPQLL